MRYFTAHVGDWLNFRGLRVKVCGAHEDKVFLAVSVPDPSDGPLGTGRRKKKPRDLSGQLKLFPVA